MPKFLTRLCLFLIFSSIIYAGMLLLSLKCIPQTYRPNLLTYDYEGDNFAKRAIDVKRFRNIDILFIGSSHASRSFDPRIFAKYNYKVFNLGSRAQSPLQSELLLDLYLKQLNPKMVVIEVFPSLFESDGTESMMDLTIDIPGTFIKVLLKGQLRNAKILNTFFCERLRNILFKQQTSSHINNIEQYIEGGFIERHSVFKKTMTNRYAGKSWQPQRLQQRAFNDIIDTLKNHKIQIVLVQTPVRKAFYKFLGDPKEVDHYFHTKGRYYNFNNNLNLNDTLDFFDGHHLSQSGVEKFDRQFIHECLKNFIMTK